MLTFAGRPKSSVFGGHQTRSSRNNRASRANRASSILGEAGGGASKLKRLSWIMSSDRPAQSPEPQSSSSPATPMPSPEDVPIDAKDDSGSSTSSAKENQSSPEPGLTAAAQRMSVSSDSDSDSSQVESASKPRTPSISFPDSLPRPDHPPSIPMPLATHSDTSVARKSSASPDSTLDKRNPSVGTTRLSSRKVYDKSTRPQSPPHQRFRNHVGFDNVSCGEATKKNLTCVTLSHKHLGYSPRRRSRSFMVGVDEHQYSDYAIQWLLDELVDDGDEIVCVRVTEKDVRLSEKQHREDANQVLQSVVAKSGTNRALSFVLEYAFGKLHATFQSLISMYQPALLIVGTKGRSHGGIQGLVTARNSFSKYCLQYSPVPVIVVRPTEKRNKKKEKRTNDSTRQTYLSMLAANNGLHEADSETSSNYELSSQNTPNEEAHEVAKVLGLPAAFDPTIKPLPQNLLPRSRPSSPHHALSKGGAASSERQQHSRSPGSAGGDTEEDDEEEEEEFDVTDGRDALSQQENQMRQEQLHKMEVGEAAALKIRLDEDEELSDEAKEAS